jgi:eukaryotic-like serine/threonine-protein kinase
MTDTPRVLARQDETAASGWFATGRTGSRLPDDVLAEQLSRLALLSVIVGALWLIGVLIDAVLFPLTWGRGVNTPGVLLDIGGLSASAILFWYVRFCRSAPQRKTTLSLGFLIANAIAVAILNTWISPPASEPTVQLSWVTVGILIYAMISPAPPRAMLVGALIAASMDPLAYTVAYLAGAPVASVPYALMLTLPNYCCAVVAVLPSRLLYRLGRRLDEARELGSYHLIERLGQGGMGEVWRARHRLLVRSAAVKLVRPDVLGAQNQTEARAMLRRFEREAQATASLGSPHTIDVFDFGITKEGTFYYVMELLTGRDLESLVREFGPVPADRAIFLLRQACHSMADAHARGLVHRDIKPANIYVCRMGLEYDFVKVLDFGLVKMRPQAGLSATVTMDHGTTGTPAYMAPEIAMGNSDVDRRADVYALGCVAYYLLTGQLVFEADTPMKMIMKHVSEQPVAPSERTELPIPKELDELVLACLRKNPDERPQDAESLFAMACNCGCGVFWDQAAASRWWETHLPELTGPLSVSVSDLVPDDRALASP